MKFRPYGIRSPCTVLLLFHYCLGRSGLPSLGQVGLGPGLQTRTVTIIPLPREPVQFLHHLVFLWQQVLIHCLALGLLILLPLNIYLVISTCSPILIHLIHYLQLLWLLVLLVVWPNHLIVVSAQDWGTGQIIGTGHNEAWLRCIELNY